MKFNKTILNILLGCIAALMCCACSMDLYQDPYGREMEGLATIIPIDGTDSCVFKCNVEYLFATNHQTTEYDQPQRVYIKYRILSYNKVNHFGLECREIEILHLDIIPSSDTPTDPGEDDKPIYPEDPGPPSDTLDNTGGNLDELYGCDPISFYHKDNYNTVCYTHIADGFLHLHVIIPVGEPGCTHEINLIPYSPVEGEPAIPNHFDLRHKQSGPHQEYDPETTIVGETVVAFDISHLELGPNDFVVVHTDNAMGKMEVAIYCNQQPII